LNYIQAILPRFDNPGDFDGTIIIYKKKKLGISMSIFNKLLQYQRKKMLKNFDAAVNHVKHGIYHSLKNETLKSNDEAFSGLLAAAVTNELFALQPTTQEAKIFALKNKKAIENEIINLKNKKTIVEMLNICLKLRAKILYENISSGTVSKINGKAIDNLKKYGLLLTDVVLPEPKKFITQARSFHKKAMNFIW